MQQHREPLEFFSVIDSRTGDRLPFERMLQIRLPERVADALNAAFNENGRFFVVRGDGVGDVKDVA